jgi:hypothetical protein
MAVSATVVLTALLSALFPSLETGAQAPIPESRPVTVTARVDAIDRERRVVRLRRLPGTDSVDVEVPPDMQGFSTLKVGDIVTATYSEAIAVRVRKPGDPAPPAPSTSTQRKEGTPGSATRREQTFQVTVTALDAATSSITVKGPKGDSRTIGVRDPKQLQGVKVGDTIDVTYYESLLINVGRQERH